MDKFQRYFKAVNFLEGLNNLPLRGDYMIDKHHADVYLKRMRYFLKLLGNPDKGLKDHPHNRHFRQRYRDKYGA